LKVITKRKYDEHLVNIDIRAAQIRIKRRIDEKENPARWPGELFSASERSFI